MRIKEKNIISPLFKYKKSSHIKLSEKQIVTRNKVFEKIEKGIYKLEESPCLCGGEEDVVVSETDRYGLPLNTVICKNCGLLRTNPKPDNKSLDEFYREEYRDLYTGPEYGDMNSYFLDMIERGKEILSLIKNYSPLEFKNLDVLEIGCSAGGILVPFLEAGANVKGYDYDQRYLYFGNNCNPSLNLNFGGLEDLRNEAKKYDLILINHVLEHLADPELAVKTIRKSLKADGILYLSVPGLKNPDYYFSPTKSFLGSLHIAHLYHFTESSLKWLMKDFDVLYIDDEIRSIFKAADKEKVHLKENSTSEYFENMQFVQNYERSFKRKAWWIKASLRNFLDFIKTVLPAPLVKLLKQIYKRVRL
jgi:2-polyprenyl-3-methyl-5-hydroxy-6-metoxy-1,4-benzoquinol methylase